MDRPIFLSLDQVLRLHEELIKAYGGAGGIRDVGLLQSALATPMATFDDEFLHRDLIEMSAAYLFHLVTNHPFLDGNKRTGAAAAIIDSRELRRLVGLSDSLDYVTGLLAAFIQAKPRGFLFGIRDATLTVVAHFHSSNARRLRVH